MPKRSNKFQKIVFMIQRHLGSSATVVESKMLRNHRTGADTEVDIAVEAKIGGVAVVMGIECTSRKRPASIEWVQQMAGKHASLPINATVLVSESGFTKNAVIEAEKCNLVPLTFEEAENAEWASILGDLTGLRLCAFRLTPLTARVYYDRVPVDAADFVIGPKTRILLGDGPRVVSMPEWIQSILSDSRVREDVMSRWLGETSVPHPSEVQFGLSWKPGEPPLWVLDDECGYRINQIDIQVRAHFNSTEVELRSIRFADASVAIGSAANVFDAASDSDSSVLITFSKTGLNEVQGSLMIPKFKGQDDAVFDVKLNES